jgi:plastocyanin
VFLVAGVLSWASRAHGEVGSPAWAAAEPTDGAAAPGSGGAPARAVKPGTTATGVIRGTVVRPERPGRRVAERYPSAARGPAPTPPPVPAAVHLEGDRLPRARPGPADRVRITQQDTAFVPAAAVVPVGTSVAFPNQDPFFHNVFSYSRPKRFDLGRFPQGESRSVVFDESGYVKVLCEVHQWMRAGILVVESPFYAVVDEDGSFVLEGVPAGRHTLVVTDFDRGTREVEVNVPEGGQIQVRVELEG